MDPILQPTILLETALVLMMLGLIFAVLVDPYMDSRRRKVMIIIVGLVFLLLF